MNARERVVKRNHRLCMCRTSCVLKQCDASADQAAIGDGEAGRLQACGAMGACQMEKNRQVLTAAPAVIWLTR